MILTLQSGNRQFDPLAKLYSDTTRLYSKFNNGDVAAWDVSKAFQLIKILPDSIVSSIDLESKLDQQYIYTIDSGKIIGWNLKKDFERAIVLSNYSDPHIGVYSTREHLYSIHESGKLSVFSKKNNFDLLTSKNIQFWEKRIWFDEKHVYVRTEKNTIDVLDPKEDLKIVHKISSPAKTVYSDESYLYTATNNQIHVYNINEEFKLIKKIFLPSDFKVIKIEANDEYLHARGRAGSNNKIYVWKKNAFELLHQFDGYLFEVDSEYFYTGSRTMGLQVWSHARELVASVAIQQSKHFESWDLDSRNIYSLQANGIIKIWNKQDGFITKLTRTIELEKPSFGSCVYSDGKYLHVVSHNTLNVFDIIQGVKLIKNIKLTHASIFPWRLFSDNKFLYCLTSPVEINSILIWSINEDFKFVKEIRPEEELNAEIITLFSDGEYLYCGGGRNTGIKIHEIDDDFKETAPHVHLGYHAIVSVHSDGRYFYAASEKMIGVWDIKNDFAPVMKIKNPLNKPHVNVLSIYSNGNFLLAAHNDNSIVVWDIKNGFKQLDFVLRGNWKELEALRLQNHVFKHQNVNLVSNERVWSPNGEVLLFRVDPKIVTEATLKNYFNQGYCAESNEGMYYLRIFPKNAAESRDPSIREIVKTLRETVLNLT